MHSRRNRGVVANWTAYLGQRDQCRHARCSPRVTHVDFHAAAGNLPGRGAHAVVLLDQAGWHLSAKLIVLKNISLPPLPAKSPELNPVENIWQFIRENWLSNRIFTSYRDILDHCCYAWNKLIDQL